MNNEMKMKRIEEIEIEFKTLQDRLCELQANGVYICEGGTREERLEFDTKLRITRELDDEKYELLFQILDEYKVTGNEKLKKFIKAHICCMNK